MIIAVIANNRSSAIDFITSRHVDDASQLQIDKARNTICIRNLEYVVVQNIEQALIWRFDRYLFDPQYEDPLFSIVKSRIRVTKNEMKF